MATPSRSVWGVIHKMSPDPSSLHILGTGGRTTKPKRKMKKASAKTVTGT